MEVTESARLKIWVAEQMGWKHIHTLNYDVLPDNPIFPKEPVLVGRGGDWYLSKLYESEIPRFTEDKNEIQLAILALVRGRVMQARFSEKLNEVLNRAHDSEPRFLGATPFHMATASALQLTKALYLTITENEV